MRALSASGEEREIAAAEAPVGTRFLVRPGERIALDGRVVSGSSEVNQAPITGESVPVGKEPGDEVFAGTINGDGALEVESHQAGRGHDARPHHPHGRGGARPARPGPSSGSRGSPGCTRRR